MDTQISRLEERIRAFEDVHRRLIWRLAAVEDRMDKQVRHGKITDVDTQKQLARMEIANKDGTTVKSPWVPYGQIAGPDSQGGSGAGGNSGGSGSGSGGAYKVHEPPAVGQQMTLLSPNGEFRQAIILPFTWYDKAQSPSTGPDPVETYGNLKIQRLTDGFIVTVGAGVFEVHADFIRGQINDSRFVATADVAKIRKGNHWFVATASGLIVSEDPQVGGDPDNH